MANAAEILRSRHGSGDLLADRRYAYAEAAARDGDAVAALDLFQQVLELTPDWLPARMGLAQAHLALGNREEAFEAFRMVAAQDEADVLGARAHLAAGGSREGGLAPGYVTALFDDYAPRFDRHLTGTLEYRVPETLNAVIAELAPGRVFARALDLGCGTGLMARALGGRARWIAGIDLSGNMIALARASGLYDELETGDCADWLFRQPAGKADLVIAADVFCYIEDLTPVFRGARQASEKNAFFAFTIQVSADGLCRVGPDLRVHHTLRFIRELAAETGFRVLHQQETELRLDRGQPVNGAIFVLMPAA